MICLRAGLSGEISKKYWTAVGAVMRKRAGGIWFSFFVPEGTHIKIIHFMCGFGHLDILSRQKSAKSMSHQGQTRFAQTVCHFSHNADFCQLRISKYPANAHEMKYFLTLFFHME